MTNPKRMFRDWQGNMVAQPEDLSVVCFIERGVRLSADIGFKNVRVVYGLQVKDFCRKLYRSDKSDFIRAALDEFDSCVLHARKNR